MNVLFAPDSYEGLLSATQAAARFEDAAALAGVFCTGHPLSDGGEGLIDVLRAHGPVELHGFEIPGPTGDVVFATAARRKGVWWVESAEATGLSLLSGDPLETSSFGLGQLIRRVANTAPGPIMVGLGGTGALDGGLGMLQALGFTLRDHTDRVIGEYATARDLVRVSRIDGTSQVSGVLIRALCDVDTAMPEASTLYGPQHDLSEDDTAEWTKGLSTLNHILRGDPTLPGGAAAGGIGLTMATVLRAGLSPGAELMAKITGLDRAVSDADVVVVGGSRLDHIRSSGPVMGEVYRRASGAGRSVHALVGRSTSSADRFASVHEIGELEPTAFDEVAQGLCEHIASLQ